MLLCVDIGNTNEKFAIFDKNQLIVRCTDLLNYKGKLTDCIEQIFDEYDISNCAFCSVKQKKETNNITLCLRKYCPCHEINSECILSFKNNYLSKTIGIDRLMAISGAQYLYQNNVLVIDCGTCITYDFLDKNNTYQGGSISLGFEIKYRALHNFTASLPLISGISEVPLCANTTKDAIVSGVINGTIAEIEQTIYNYKTQYEVEKIVMCGGDAPFIAKHLTDKEIIIDKNIVLWGLNCIYKLNNANNI